MSYYINIEKAEEDFFNFRCDGCKVMGDCKECLIYEGAEYFINYDSEEMYTKEQVISLIKDITKDANLDAGKFLKEWERNAEIQKQKSQG